MSKFEIVSDADDGYHHLIEDGATILKSKSKKQVERALIALAHYAGSGSSGDIIYVVLGSSGEYSDRREWLVAWFPNRGIAEAYQKCCQNTGVLATAERQRLMDNDENEWYGMTDEQQKAAIAKVAPYDPNLQFSGGYDELHYHVEEVRAGYGT